MQYIPQELSEDCLYLNVYTPTEATKGAKLPVGSRDSMCLLVQTTKQNLLTAEMESSRKALL